MNNRHHLIQHPLLTSNYYCGSKLTVSWPNQACGQRGGGTRYSPVQHGTTSVQLYGGINVNKSTIRDSVHNSRTRSPHMAVHADTKMHTATQSIERHASTITERTSTQHDATAHNTEISPHTTPTAGRRQACRQLTRLGLVGKNQKGSQQRPVFTQHPAQPPSSGERHGRKRRVSQKFC
jgi:hypothetical protein